MFYTTPFGRLRNKPGFHLVGDNWNDYSFYTLYRLYYLDNNLKETDIGYVKIGYKDQVESSTILKSTFESVPEDYFSLGQGVEYYSKLRKLGDDVRIECLSGLKDIAYLEDLYSDVIEEAVVTTSLLRDMNRKIVDTQFRRIAHGGAVLTPYDFKFQVPSKKKIVTFDFEVEPDSKPPTNIHTIIGTNGSGKTTTLKGILKGYLKKELEEEFSNAIFISFSIFDEYGEYVSSDVDLEYYYVGAKSQESKTKSHDDLKSEFFRSIKTVLSKKRHLYLHRMLELLNADYNLESLGLISILENYIDTTKNNNEVEQCSARLSEIFTILSSGHKIILLSITKIVELIVEKRLILIDEPETHLHPPLLSSFIRAISEITIAENAVAILATYSPVVLQEIPKSCVSIIRKHGTEIKIGRPRFETFGENVGVLTEEVFGLEIPKTGFHALLKREIKKNPDYDEIIDLFNNELSIEAKSIIRTYINEIKKDE